MCALKSHKSVGRYVRELKSGQLRVNRAAVSEEAKLDGKYLVSTTDPTLSAEDVALGYKQLSDAERAFRTLKHTLELRPMQHRLPERIRAHVLLCWLVLLLIRLIEIETDESWELVRDELEQIHLVNLRSIVGTVRLVTELTANQRKPLSRLAIPQPKQSQRSSTTP